MRSPPRPCWRSPVSATAPADLAPVVTGREIERMGRLADMVHVDPAVISYVRRLAEASREVPGVRIGLSTRGVPGLDPGGEGVGARRAVADTWCPRTSRRSRTRCSATGC